MQKKIDWVDFEKDAVHEALKHVNYKALARKLQSYDAYSGAGIRRIEDRLLLMHEPFKTSIQDGFQITGKQADILYTLSKLKRGNNVSNANHESLRMACLDYIDTLKNTGMSDEKIIEILGNRGLRETKAYDLIQLHTNEMAKMEKRKRDRQEGRRAKFLRERKK